MGRSENPDRDFPPVGNYVLLCQQKKAFVGELYVGRWRFERTQDLLQLHDCGICSQPLMHGMILARVAGIEDLSILVVVVLRHGEEM